MAESETPGDVARKLEVIRNASRHRYPVGDIDAMLAEIEGRGGTTAADPAACKIEKCENS